MNMEHNADQLKQLGNQAYKKGDFKKALNFYNKAIQQNPKQSAFYLNRALCHFNMKNYLQCVSDCGKSIDLHPQYIKAMKKMATAYVQLLKFQQALSILKRANSIQKTQATSNEIQEIQHYHSNFTKYHEAFKAQNYPQALSCISYLVTKIPSNKQLKLYKIQCLAKTGATDEAHQTLKPFIHEISPQICYLKGIIELYSGDSAKAKNHFAQGIRLDPQNVICQKALNKAKKCEKFKEQGNQFIKASNWQSAEVKYTDALNLDPYNKKLNSIIYSNRALTYMKRKMWIKAAEDLNKSIELNPNYLKSYVKRAEVNMQRREYSTAINDYAKIQQLDPSINLKAKIQQAKKKQRQAKKKDYYAVLGVAKTAKDDEIKKAYKKLALKYHPDRNRNKSQVQQEQASKKFKDICEAQDVLTNPEKKKLYDSGGMDFDGDAGNFSGFSSEMGMGGFSNMGQFNSGNGNFKFTMNGQEMGGGIDPTQIFSMFMGKGMGGMGGMGKKGTNSSQGQQQTNKPKGFGGFSGFDGFDNFDFGNMGGMGGFPSSSYTKFSQKTKQN